MDAYSVMPMTNNSNKITLTTVGRVIMFSKCNSQHTRLDDLSKSKTDCFILIPFFNEYDNYKIFCWTLNHMD